MPEPELEHLWPSGEPIPAEETRGKRDIVVTWPKTRSLQSYLDELERAEELGLRINYRVARLPRWSEETLNLDSLAARCYVVHDGAIRGWNDIITAEWYEDNEVSRVENDAWAGFWPAGWYVVRDPHWYPIDPIVSMKGFQGWRWYDR